METLNYLFFILTAVIFFYLGRDRSFKIKERLEALKELTPKKQYGTPLVIDTDEAELEEREKKQEKEIIDVSDAIKANEQS